jgi:CheY-like chemotaxis protein
MEMCVTNNSPPTWKKRWLTSGTKSWPRRKPAERCRETSSDLVITPIKMLDLDGLKAARQIRGTCRPLSSKMTVPGLFCGVRHRPDQRRNLLK